jgi:hypothetical protein
LPTNQRAFGGPPVSKEESCERNTVERRSARRWAGHNRCDGRASRRGSSDRHWPRPVGRVQRLAIGVVRTALALVPANRASGSNDPRLARFYAQHVRWHKCQRGPHDTDGKTLDAAGARCADIRVPLDYAHPGGRVITIAISRLAAVPSAKKIGPMIINLGGPATPVLADVVLAREAMGATGARFDLIGMDQRFSGRGPSSRLCTTASSTWAARRAR